MPYLPDIQHSFSRCGIGHGRLFPSVMRTLLAAFGIGMLSCPLSAADASWNVDANGNWTSSSNWTASSPSAPADTATFGNIITANRTITLNANRSISDLIFNSPFTYTLSGANTLTLNNTTGLTINGSGNALLNVNGITLASNQSWTGSGSGNVRVASVLQGSSSLTKSGAFTLTLNGNNTFAGGLRLESGVTEFGSNTGAGTGTLTFAGGTLRAVGGTTATAPSRVIANTVNVTADTMIDGIQGFTFTGPMTLTGGSKTFTVNNTALTTFAGVIGQQFNAGFTKAGTGNLAVSGNNTFTGAVNVTGGTLTLRHQNALGANNTWGNSVSNGATLALENNISVKEDGFTFSGNGVSGLGALRNVSGNNTLDAFIDLGGATTFTSTTGSLTLAGTVTANHALTLNSANNSSITVSASIQGNQSINKTGAGTLTYSGSSANVFSGTTTVNQGTLVLNKTAGASAIAGDLIINNGGTVRLDASNQIVDSGANIRVNQGGTLNLNNQSDAIYSLTLTGGTVSTGTGTLTLANTGSGALTTNAASASATISGRLALDAYSHAFAIADGSASDDLLLNASLTGSGQLVKTGAGTLTFAGVSNDYTGSLFLNEGALRFVTDNIFTASTDLTIAGGTLFLNDTAQRFDSLTVTGNSVIDFGASSLLNLNSLSIASGATLTITNWTESIDYFYSQFAPGTADLSRITFASAPVSGAQWQSFDQQIKPVPEPATYGAILSLAGLGLYFWRRKKQNA
jgi:autotransporter-associated beta strand protein